MGKVNCCAVKSCALLYGHNRLSQLCPLCFTDFHRVSQQIRSVMGEQKRYLKSMFRVVFGKNGNDMTELLPWREYMALEWRTGQRRLAGLKAREGTP